MRFAKWLTDVRIGVETEAIRLAGDGSLSTTPHPFEDGDLHFTQDFAENQLEVVTDPFAGAKAAYAGLQDHIHHAMGTLQRMDETLWPFSMPPNLPDDDAIPLAVFNNSEMGRRRHLYRKGLASRFGKRRQLICGVHINISMGNRLLSYLQKTHGVSADTLYLRGARHLFRCMENLVLLTGGSPVAGEAFPFSRFNRDPVVSVRNSREGYASTLFDAFLDLSSVAAYVAHIRKGLNTAVPEYLKKGLVKDGAVVQLSTRVFQSEKEFYSPVRLRQLTAPEESQTQALERRGVGYLELRFFDRDPFEPGGVGLDTLRLVHLMFLEGVLGPNNNWDRDACDRAFTAARSAAETRLSDLLYDSLTASQLRERTRAVLEALMPLAETVDRTLSTNAYTTTLLRARHRVDHPSTLLTARIEREFRKSNTTWTQYGLSVVDSRNQEAKGELHHTGI